MRISEGVEWALHCATVLALLPAGTALSAGRLAEFHGVPAAYLAKHLQALTRAGVLGAVPGPRGGYRLARPPQEITLLAVVDAVEGREPTFRCAEIRQRGPAALPGAYLAPCAIARAMWRAEDAWRAELANQTLGDVLVALGSTVDPRSAAKAAAWLQEVLP